MLRSTRSRLVTKIDIVPARRSCNLIKSKSFAVLIVVSSDFASSEATVGWLTLGPWPRLRGRPAFWRNIAGGWRSFNRDGGQGRGLLWNQDYLGLRPAVFTSRGKGGPRAFAAP